MEQEGECRMMGKKEGRSRTVGKALRGRRITEKTDLLYSLGARSFPAGGWRWRGPLWVSSPYTSGILPLSCAPMIVKDGIPVSCLFPVTLGPDREQCRQCTQQPDVLGRLKFPGMLTAGCSSQSSHCQTSYTFSAVGLYKMPWGLWTLPWGPWTLFFELGLFQLFCVSPKVELGFAICHDAYNVASGLNHHVGQHSLIFGLLKKAIFILFKVSHFGDDLIPCTSNCSSHSGF